MREGRAPTARCPPLAAGVTGQPLDHTEVLAAGAAGATRLTTALRALVPAVARV